MKIIHIAFGAALLTAAMMTPSLANTYHTSGDVTVFDSNGTQTFLAPGADLGRILSGSASAPRGNVELNDGSASANLSAPANTLTAYLNSGREVTFSSLTNSDWFGPDNLAKRWFSEAMDAYGSTITTRYKDYLMSLGYRAPQATAAANDSNNIFNTFSSAGGFARLSDPNIAYIGESSAGVTFGLAGHSDAGNISSLLTGLYASEVVKVSLKGNTQYYYSFAQPTNSGQTSREDRVSHAGNYEFFIADPVEPESVPEPTTLLGLLALGGWAVSRRKATVK
ncbi:MAG: NF038130 family PEP-CTERM protein [Phormidesmis sp.]